MEYLLERYIQALGNYHNTTDNMNTQQFEEVAKKTGFDRDKISVDLTEYYNRVKKHAHWTQHVVSEWGSVENYIDLLYWMKFQKKYNPTQIIEVTGKKTFPRSYNNIGWGMATYDFEQCNKAHDEHLKKLYELRDTFDINSPIFEEQEFQEKTKDARSVLSRKMCAYYEVKSVEELVRRLYYYHHVNELSTFEVATLLGATQRSIEKLLAKTGLGISKSESQKRAASKRDYGRVFTTQRHTRANSLVRNGVFGSKAENMVRTILATKLENLLAVEYEIIVGLNTTTIIPPLEIDIPVILIEKKTGKINKIAIEVDGEKYHQTTRMQLRDANKDNVVKEHDWHMVRVFIPLGMETYSEDGGELNEALEDIAKSIQEYLNDSKESPLKDISESDVTEAEQKICPKCGGTLVKRVARKGTYAGNEFWGCSNYPKCNYILNEA